jgi:hypothetical protein
MVFGKMSAMSAMLAMEKNRAGSKRGGVWWPLARPNSLYIKIHFSNKYQKSIADID